LIALGLLAAHHHATGAQRVFAVDLVHAVPTGLLHGRADELVADVAFRKVLLMHGIPPETAHGTAMRLLRFVAHHY
jgi:hypothetical protein